MHIKKKETAGGCCSLLLVAEA